jgi:hypothetical protein
MIVVPVSPLTWSVNIACFWVKRSRHVFSHEVIDWGQICSLQIIPILTNDAIFYQTRRHFLVTSCRWARLRLIFQTNVCVFTIMMTSGSILLTVRTIMSNFRFFIQQLSVHGNRNLLIPRIVRGSWNIPTPSLVFLNLLSVFNIARFDPLDLLL